MFLKSWVMKSNYNKLDQFIQQIDVRNTYNKITYLRGVSSVSKSLMKSKANTIGTDMKKYKILEYNQFAFNPNTARMGDKIPIALNKGATCLVSQIYPVFEITNTNKLHPEYLMMWFRRPEFDRYARYKSHGSAREIFDWEEMCNVELPLPSIEKQQEVVNEYNTVTNRIKLNEQLNKKLEETAQAIYKHWFVDFEFPDKDGKPYKTSGGKMVWNEVLEKEIPEGWKSKSFTKIFKLMGGGTPSTSDEFYWDGEIPFFTPKDISSSYYTFNTEKNITEFGLMNCSSKKYQKNTVFITARGTVGAVAIAGRKMAMNQSCYAIINNRDGIQFFTHQQTLETIKQLKEEAVGAVFNALVTKDFDACFVCEPEFQILEQFEMKIISTYKLLEIKSIMKIELKEIRNLLLSKMAKG